MGWIQGFSRASLALAALCLNMDSNRKVGRKERSFLPQGNANPRERCSKYSGLLWQTPAPKDMLFYGWGPGAASLILTGSTRQGLMHELHVQVVETSWKTRVKIGVCSEWQSVSRKQEEMQLWGTKLDVCVLENGNLESRLALLDGAVKCVVELARGKGRVDGGPVGNLHQVSW